MTELATTIAEVLGALLVVAGLALVSIPASVIVAGVLLILGSYLAASR